MFIVQSSFFIICSGGGDVKEIKVVISVGDVNFYDLPVAQQEEHIKRVSDQIAKVISNRVNDMIAKGKSQDEIISYVAGVKKFLDIN